MENHQIKRVCSGGRSLSECVADYNLPGNPELYEKHAEQFCYAAPAYCADILSGILGDDKKTALILDVASGPGQVGQALQRVGFERIHAHDGSRAMLEVCRRKNVYDSFICCVIDDKTRLPVDDDTYDAVAISGAILEHHLPPSSQSEFVRVVKPGGYIMCSYSTDILDTDYGINWRTETNRLVENGGWNLHSEAIIPDFYEGVEGVVEVFRKASYLHSSGSRKKERVVFC